jgi:hypothetical protein
MTRVQVLSSYQTVGEISYLQLHTKETKLIIQRTRKQLLSEICWKATSQSQGNCYHATQENNKNFPFPRAGLQTAIGESRTIFCEFLQWII